MDGEELDNLFFADIGWPDAATEYAADDTLVIRVTRDEYDNGMQKFIERFARATPPKEPR